MNPVSVKIIPIPHLYLKYILGNFILHDWKTPGIKKCLSVPPVVYPSTEVILVVWLPSNSIYGLLKRFPMGIFHPISVLTSAPLPTPPQKKRNKKKTMQLKRLVLIVTSDIYLNARASCLGGGDGWRGWPVSPSGRQTWPVCRLGLNSQLFQKLFLAVYFWIVCQWAPSK